MSRKRRKKKSGCAKGVIVVLLLLLTTVVLISTGVIASMKTYVEKQIYPLKYEETILQASEDYGFSPEFICAVIHTESKFRESAESSAGAKGLMQLMPETFLWIGEIRGLNCTAEDILTPDVNIDYGVYYLRKLTDQYEDVYTACAAYNAGNVVRDWLENEEYSQDGKTLSSIPYEETSDYVKRIKAAEEMYRKLYFEE